VGTLASETLIPEAAPENRRPGRYTIAALLGVLAIGAFLRFYALDAQSLWNDELSTWEQSHYDSIADVIEYGVRPHPYPPGFQILIYYVEQFVGQSEIALRLPSAIAGVLAIIAIYWLAQRVYSRREAAIAATLMAFSYQPIYYSQEARAYSLLLLIAVVSGHAWFRLRDELEHKNLSRGAIAAYMAAAIAAIYTHHFGLLLVGVQLGGLFILFVNRRWAVLRVAAIGAGIGAAYLPWLSYLLEDFENPPPYLPPPGLHSIIDYWRFLFFDTSGYLVWFLSAILATAIFKSALSQPRPQPSMQAWKAALRSPTALIIAWLVVPFALTYARSLTATPILNNRNLLICLPPAFLLLSRAITLVIRQPRTQVFATAGIAIALIFGPFVKGGYYQHPRKTQFREAAAAVAENPTPVESTQVIAYAWSKPLFDYYLERLGSPLRVGLLAGVESDIERTRQFIDQHQPQQLWFLAGHRKPERAYIQFLDSEFEFIGHVPLLGAFARQYRVRPLPGLESETQLSGL
jgi:4-amino-4-deoxy-L-arabinose transferase-like glycosyltransferase